MSDEVTTPGAALRSRVVFTGAAGLVVLLAGLVVALGHGVVARLGGIDPLPPHPMLAPALLPLLYLGMPAVVLSVLVLLLAPGLLAMLAFGREERFALLVVKGFALSYVLLVLADSAAKAVLPTPFSPVTAALLLTTLGLLAWGAFAWRVGRGAPVTWPVTDPTVRRRALWLVIIAWVAVVAFLPWLFWQDLNPDGVEALEIGRSLATHAIPRFANSSGFMGLGIGMVSMAYPIHWFHGLFGTTEAVTRLPIVLYLPPLFAALVALVELPGARLLRAGEEAAVALALITTTAVLGWNSSYDPYAADMSSPAAYELLTMLCFAASTLFLFREERRWFLLFAALGFLARPTGLLIVLFAALAGGIVWPERRRRLATDVALALLTLVVVYIGYEKVFIAIAAGGRRPGYPSEAVIHRFAYVTLVDWRRFLWVAGPAGFVPFVSLFFARRDKVAFALALVTGLYFLVFLFPAFTSLHHFVPAMVLPIAVFWRLIAVRVDQRWPAAVGLAAGVLAWWLAVPPSLSVTRNARRIGYATEFRIGCYTCVGNDAGHRLAIRHRDILFRYFPADWNVTDPSRERVGGQNLLHYAVQPKPPGTVINYIVQPSDAPAPAGFLLVGPADSVGATYVRDSTSWNADRYGTFNLNYQSAFYRVGRETLFPFVGVKTHHYTIAIRNLPLLWRLF